MKKKLKGDRFSIIDFYGCADPDMPNLSNNQIKELYEIAKPKISKPIGKIFIFGTGGDL